LLLLARTAIADTAAAPPPPAPPEPEQYVSSGRYSAYAEAAKNFVRDHPDAPAAPRVAMDLLVTAAVFDDQELATTMREFLVVTYPGSVQAKYIIGSMPDGGQFAALMSLVADQSFQTMPATFATRYDQAMRLGIARFGAAAMGDGGQLVRNILIGRAAGDQQMVAAGVKLLNDGGARDELWRRIITIVADETTPVMTRVSRLHELSNRFAAIPFEQFLLAKLADADRKSAAATTILADDMLESGDLSDALPLLEKLCDEGADTRIQFWRAWATAGNGDSVAADRLLRNLNHDHGDDAWGKEAGDLAPGIAALDADLVANIEGALLVTRRLQTGVGTLEGHATFLGSDGQRISVYAGFNSPKLYELLFQRGTDTAVAYRATDTEAWLYTQGNPQIEHYTKPVMLAAPSLSIVRAGVGFRVHADLKFTYSFDDLTAAFSNLVATDLMTTREGLGDILRDFSRRGIVPMPSQSAAAGATTYTWVSPDVATPTVNRVAITVAPDGTISSLQSGGLNLSDLHYGTAGSFAITPPALPAGPTEDKGPMTVSILQTVLPAVYGLFNPPPPSTQPAAGAAHP